jgi:hypothetical protein
MNEAGTMVDLYAQLEQERDSARNIAVRLEQENAHLRSLLAQFGWENDAP